MDSIAINSDRLITGCTINFEELVGHRFHLAADEQIGNAYEKCRAQNHEFFAVLEGGRVMGIASRAAIGFLLGSRYGYSIYARHPIRDCLIAHPLLVHKGDDTVNVLDRALSRAGDEFYEDIALLDEADGYLGMIPVQKLVQLQTRLLAEQAQLAEAQRRELQVKNQELFRSLNQLRQSEGRFGILFRNSALGVVLLNTRGQIEARNQRMDALLEPVYREHPPATLAEMLAPQLRDAWKALLQLVECEADGSKGHAGEFLFHLPNRGPRLFKVSASWIPETGQICVLLDDVTEQRVLERHMFQKEKAAMIESLVGGIAHEINNKLVPIIGFAELLTMDDGNAGSPKVLRYCRTIRDAAQESARIIRQLLQLSRPAGSVFEVCDLRTVVEDTVAILGLRLRTARVALRVELPTAACPALGDVGQLKQVVINMVLNAMDAMDRSDKKELRISLSADGPRLILQVSDSGQGIAPEVASRIFDPFFTTKPPDRGTGLGLSVCYGIVKQHNGVIDFDTHIGVGTTFRITLPAADVNLPAHGRDARTGLPAPAGTVVENLMTRKRVLIVDDEDYITCLVQEGLRQKLGCQVERVMNGALAVTQLVSEPFDLVISDVRMPIVDGFGLHEWICCERPELRQHFLFITGDAGSPEMNARLDQLGVPVLRKPFSLDELIARCQPMLKK